MSSSTPESSQPVPSEGPVTENRDERMWASFCHLAAFASVAVPLFGNFLGPLVVWLIEEGRVSAGRRSRQGGPELPDQHPHLLGDFVRFDLLSA